MAVQRVAEAVAAAHSDVEPLVLTARAENHIRGVDDLDDTIARLVPYRDAGADVVYAPGRRLDRSLPVVGEVGIPVNVLALPVALRSAILRESASATSRPGASSRARPTALVAGCALREEGTSRYGSRTAARGRLARVRLTPSSRGRAGSSRCRRAAPSPSPPLRP
jgi:2-methylisocitrate lyase-like PEP mutase family enzyme